MSISQYLDDEFFRLQGQISKLVETLPIIKLEAIHDKNSFLKVLVEQNKAYACYIISLHQASDANALFKSSRAFSTSSQGPQNTELMESLKAKVKEYEEAIQAFTHENNDLLSQIKDLSQQVKRLQERQEYRTDNSRRSYSANRENLLTGSGRNTVRSTRPTIEQAPSEITLEIENYLSKGELKKASSTLAAIDYKKPHDVAIETFNDWLVSSNRVKDSEISEILVRLKAIVNNIEEEDEEIQRRRQRYGRESLKQAEMSSWDKLLSCIEEKISKVCANKLSPRQPESLMKRLISPRSSLAYEQMNTRELRSPEKIIETEREYASEHLQGKVEILRKNVSSMELELQGKHEEVENLKERLIKVKGGHSRQGSIGTDNLQRDLDNEVRNRLKLETRLQDMMNENEELREVNESLLRKNKEYDQKVLDLSQELHENQRLINQYERENENYNQDLELIEQLKEEIKYKDTEISALSREITSLKAIAKGNTQEQRSSAQKIEEEALSKGSKENLVLESALRIQENLLFNINQVFKDLKTGLKATIEKSNISLPQEAERIYGSNDGLANPKTEAQKILKENNRTIQDLLKEVYIVKSVSEALGKGLGEDNSKIDVNDLKVLCNKVRKEEDKLLERLSKCLKVLSDLRTSICSIKTPPEAQTSSNTALSILQDLYTTMSQAINELPELSNEIDSLQRKKVGRGEDIPERRNDQRGSRDQVAREQSDLRASLKVRLESIRTTESEEASKHVYSLEDMQRVVKQLQAKDNLIASIISMFKEGLDKANDSISQLAKIADSEDAFILIGDILSEIDTLKTSIIDFADAERRNGFNFGNTSSGRNSERQATLRSPRFAGAQEIEGINQQFAELKDRLVQTTKENKELREKLAKNSHETRDTKSPKTAMEGTQLMIKIGELEKENQELRERQTSNDIAIKRAYEQATQLKLNYLSDITTLKEEKKAWAEERKQLVKEIEAKNEELFKVNKLLDSLQNLSNKQLEVVRDKEQRLEAAIAQNKECEQWIRDLEKKAEALTKENKEASEALVKKEEELEKVKRDLENAEKNYTKAQEICKQAESKCSEMTNLNKTLRDEHQEKESQKSEMSVKVRKLNELLQVTKNELKNCRQMVEEKNAQLNSKDEEIQLLKEALKNERNLHRESDFVLHLKNEIQAQDNEMMILKHKYNEQLRVNEMLKSEIQSLTNSNYKNSFTIKKELLDEHENLQKSQMRRRDAQYHIGGSGLQSATRSLQNTLSGSTIESDLHEKEYKNSALKEQKLVRSRVQLSSTKKDNNIFDEKDIEIQRLTNAVKELTKSLVGSQDAKYSSHKSTKFQDHEQ